MTQSSADLVTPRPSFLALCGGIFVLFMPMAVLFAVTAHAGQTPLVAGGIATEAFLAFGLLHQVGTTRASSHKTASPVYLIALLILWMSANDYHDIYPKVGMFILVGVPLFLFVCQEFIFTDASGLSKARTLVRRLAAKTDWPAELTACKSLPEVKALREALREDAEPVMILLMHPNPQVRIAALASLEFRPAWRTGQAERVLHAAKFATEPSVRIAALMALANVDDANLAVTIAIYLRDATQEVRKGAAEALLWDGGRRWALVRRELRNALADPRFLDDGPLPLAAAMPDAAKVDLMIWSGESGPVSKRAALTLMAHFRRELNENPSVAVVDGLARLIRDENVPSSLRVEFARLLAEQDFVDDSLWRDLLGAGRPSYLRLLAAGALLRQGNDEAALEALREVARVPNREIALQVAVIVQRVLRVDMGLPLGGRVPSSQSKVAAEVARRVIDWSAGVAAPLVDDHALRRTRISSIAWQIPKPSGDQPRPRG